MSRSHLQTVDDGKIADQFVRQSVHEVVAVWLGTEVLQRQDRNNRLFGGIRRRAAADGRQTPWFLVLTAAKISRNPNNKRKSCGNRRRVRQRDQLRARPE